MKKLIIIALLFAACKPSNQNGIYVNHTEGQFSIADDTLIVRDTIVINHCGYQKIRHGELLPKSYKTRKWTLNSPDAPIMQFSTDRIVIGSTIYQKMP